MRKLKQDYLRGIWMQIIVDTNVILSALIKQGKTRTILTNPLTEFFTIEFAIQEIRKYKTLVLEKSGLTDEEFEIMLSLLLGNVKIVLVEQIQSRINEAKEIMRNIDLKDAPILACALSIPNDGLWTEDKHLKKQGKAKVYNTQEMIELIG
jgi:predicted nucleic acid-binding protein